jgi:hypothetical protein
MPSDNIAALPLNAAATNFAPAMTKFVAIAARTAFGFLFSIVQLPAALAAQEEAQFSGNPRRVRVSLTVTAQEKSCRIWRLWQTGLPLLISAQLWLMSRSFS